MKFSLLTLLLLVSSTAFSNEGQPILCFGKERDIFIKGFLSNDYTRSDFAIYNLDTLQSVYIVPTHVEILSHSALILEFKHMRVFLQSNSHLPLYDALENKERVRAQFQFKGDSYLGDHSITGAFCKLDIN